ncbi:MAG TPA: addiction module protein [Anaerolineae bacterium]|nr:addiction module protein [Anaerolineae bacterium]
MEPDKIAAEINSLNLPQKLILVEDIWDSIALDSGKLPLSKRQKKELAKRYNEYNQGKLELPQQIMLFKKHEPEKLLRDLSDALGCDLELFRESLRIPEKDKVARDLMIYFLWRCDPKVAQQFRRLPVSASTVGSIGAN